MPLISTPCVGMCSTANLAGCAASAGGSVKIAAGTDCARAKVEVAESAIRTTRVGKRMGRLLDSGHSRSFRLGPSEFGSYASRALDTTNCNQNIHRGDGQVL